MARQLGFAAIPISFLLAACGGRQEAVHSPASPSAGDSDAAATAETYASAGGYSQRSFSEESAGAPQADLSMEGESAYSPTPSRPGLGTSFGEARYSPVRSVSFVRHHAENPFAVSMLHYNDQQGIRSMAGGYVGFEPCRVAVNGGSFTVTLEDEGGRALPAVRHGGRTWAVGEHGTRYTIRIDNHTPHRIEAVATVDGLDVIDGGEGSFSKRGYLVGARDSLSIQGFRTSEEDVASFRFGSVDDAYAEKRGKGRNIGVIGVAFFREEGAVWDFHPSETRRRQSADPFPSRFAPPPPGY